MPKIVNNTFIATSSIIPIVDTDYVVFVSSSNIYMLSASSVQQLNLGTGYYRIVEYTGSSRSNQSTIYTYEVSPLVKMITVVAMGSAGGGGGGARKDSVNTLTRAGGGGGAGAGLVVVTLMSQSLSPSYLITVPGATSGGLGGSLVDGNGFNGGNGTLATFGSIIAAPGGAGGIGGSDDAFTVQPSTNAIPAYAPYFTPGCEGAVVQLNNSADAGPDEISSGKYRTDPYWRAAMSGIRSGGGGGGGGLITTSHTTQSGRSGSGVNIYGTITPPGTPGRIDGQAAGISPSNVLNAIHLFGISGSLLSCKYGVGAGGSGGAATNIPNTSGGAGANGGYFGAAGGGGGAGSGSNGGAGGSGSAGYVAILEFY